MFHHMFLPCHISYAAAAARPSHSTAATTRTPHRLTTTTEPTTSQHASSHFAACGRMPSPQPSGGLLRRALRAVDRFLSVDLTPPPLHLYSFASPADVRAWNLFSDASFGGTTQASFALSEGQRVRRQLTLQRVSDNTTQAADPWRNANPTLLRCCCCCCSLPATQTAVFAGKYSKEVLESSRLIRAGYAGVNQVVSIRGPARRAQKHASYS
jgi:hypothetical protein